MNVNKYIYKFVYVQIYMCLCISHASIHITLLGDCIGKILWKKIIIDATVEHTILNLKRT